MEHTRRFGGNLNLIFEDLRRIQRVSGYAVDPWPLTTHHFLTPPPR